MTERGVRASFGARLFSFSILGVFASSCLQSRQDGSQTANVARCTTCHGDPARAGDYLLRAAPPTDLAGGTEPSFPGVGAHSIHLSASATHAALSCSECHVVPERTDSPGHGDHGSPARLVFGALAKSGDHAPHYDPATRSCRDSYCHGSGEAVWNAPRSSERACGSCHGLPPALPHPQSARCSLCHGAVVDDATRIISPVLHVNGVVDIGQVEAACTSCHGSANSAPPQALTGETATSAAGVGAHQTHVQGTASSRAVPCAECHVVPERVLDPGHLDSALPAEVIFSGAALAYGAAPRYVAGACQNTACHGAVFPDGHASGGTLTAPIWTEVDGTQASCGTCHGLPPPAPHPYVQFNPVCGACHQDIAPDNRTFVRPELHADGIVTFSVP